MAGTIRVELPEKLHELYSAPRGQLRYRVMRGGRGSGKSFSAAKVAAIWGAIEPLRILCVREFQNSIKESFHAELKNAINSDPWLSSVYDVGIDYLRHKSNGTEFIFKGLRHNIEGVKSMAQIDLVIAEEAETIPPRSWQDLIPTIRAPGSEIWIIYNPRSRASWVARTFDTASLPPRTFVADISYDDNPWFPPELEEQRQHAERTMDDALYRHVWEGDYYEQSDAQVFRGKYVVEEFEPHEQLWQGPYYGIDFGFSQDPTTGVKCWIADRRLYIEYDAGKVGLELDQTAEFLSERIPGIDRHTARADSARPESISYLKRSGLFGIEGVDKWKGSVEDGVEFIKSFDTVVIHPRCQGTLSEFRLYSYKIDRLSGDILPVIIDDNNHYIDAIRYAIAPVIRGGIIDYSAIV